MPKFQHSVDAISPILATLLLIVIVVATSIAAYAWIQSSTQSQINTAGGFIIIENTRFYETDQIDITVRSTGTADVTIDAIYVNDYRFTVTQNIQTGESETMTLDYSWESEGRIKIKAATTSGLIAERSYSPSTDSGNFVLLDDGFEDYNVLSTHKIPLKVLAKMFRKELDSEIVVIGIQPKNIGFEEKLSEEVEKIKNSLEEVISSLASTESR